MMSRREILSSAFAAAVPLAGAPRMKIGHRQASLRTDGPAVFDLAKRIPGLSGVELQVQFRGTTLWDDETRTAYKKAADRTGLRIPSLAGIWEKGTSLIQPRVADETIRKSIRTAELLGAPVILVAAFKANCPRMDDEQSYGPVVAMLQKVAPAAADAGVTLGLETSLSPQDDGKLVDLVGHPRVKVYFDANNTELYGHTGGSISGISVLGKSRICQVHCKNEDRLLEEQGRVEWAGALKALKQIGYDGWYVFETRHSSPEQSIEATRKNIEFLERHSL